MLLLTLKELSLLEKCAFVCSLFNAHSMGDWITLICLVQKWRGCAGVFIEWRLKSAWPWLRCSRGFSVPPTLLLLLYLFIFTLNSETWLFKRQDRGKLGSPILFWRCPMKHLIVYVDLPSTARYDLTVNCIILSWQIFPTSRELETCLGGRVPQRIGSYSLDLYFSSSLLLKW